MTAQARFFLLFRAPKPHCALCAGRRASPGLFSSSARSSASDFPTSAAFYALLRRLLPEALSTQRVMERCLLLPWHRRHICVCVCVCERRRATLTAWP